MRAIHISQRECIPVGWVPSSAVAVPAWGRGVMPGGFACRREVCLPAGGGRGVCCQWGCLPVKGGVCPGGCGTDTPYLWTEWQTRVKTLPFRNYTGDGKNVLHEDINRRTIEIPQSTHCLNVHNVPFKLALVNLVQSWVKMWRFTLLFTT